MLIACLRMFGSKHEPLRWVAFQPLSVDLREVEPRLVEDATQHALERAPSALVRNLVLGRVSPGRGFAEVRPPRSVSAVHHELSAQGDGVLLSAFGQPPPQSIGFLFGGLRGPPTSAHASVSHDPSTRTRIASLVSQGMLATRIAA